MPCFVTLVCLYPAVLECIVDIKQYRLTYGPLGVSCIMLVSLVGEEESFFLLCYYPVLGHTFTVLLGARAWLTV